MEALAEGDTESRIAYSDHRDCVGRMARAMSTFRRNAVDVRASKQAQELVVHALKQALSALAANNLSCQIDDAFPGAYEDLRVNFNRALASLSETIGCVHQSAGTVMTSAGEIRSASDDLARRNERQAANVEHTAATVGQVTVNVSEMAFAAGEVQKSIALTHGEASAGGALGRPSKRWPPLPSRRRKSAKSSG